ncbi:MAG TPA: Holliday junction branch migration protein RuvA [Planctomycetota bacterium]|nr:Holliday junction branch migration protein RuvA [Planctomycetota bacterium]
MYDFLRGHVVAIDAGNRLSFDVGGIGYSLRISEWTRKYIPLDGSVTTISVRLQVKEDDLVLFGFADVAERAAFDLLTSVQGVGPGVAMAVLSAMGVDDLRRALVAKDVAALKKVKGVGPKSAERIALELADKVERIPTPLIETPRSTSGAAQVEEAHRALVVLGFSPKEAADALAKAAKPGLPSEDLLRAALALLR